MRAHLVWAAALAFTATVAAITVLVALGHDPTSLIVFLTGLPATIASVYVLIRTGQVEAKVDVVSKNVNGHLERLSTAAGLPPKPPATDGSTTL